MKRNRADIDHLAIAIAGTRRNPKSLSVNRVSAAESLLALRKIYGCTEGVAAKVGISAEMVREFLCLLRLSPDALEYWKRGKISSIDIGYRISARVPRDHQEGMARIVLERGLTTKDVDAITSYLRQHASLSVEQATTRVLKSKDKVVYVAEYSIKPSVAQECHKIGLPADKLWRRVEGALRDLAGRGNVVDCTCQGNVLRIKVNNHGLSRLRHAAKAHGVPLRALATTLARRAADSHPQRIRSG